MKKFIGGAFLGLFIFGLEIEWKEGHHDIATAFLCAAIYLGMAAYCLLPGE